jgi:protocatechuate 3,4-dioxygenase, beta subunit
VLCAVATHCSVLAQKQPSDVADAPKNLSSSARIAPIVEPGTPLIITGKVVAADGKTPVAGVTVYAYHTDNSGYYRRGLSPQEAEENPRLRGWAKTDSAGRFEFTTIKPAPYPKGDTPAHIHVHAWGTGYPRQWFELKFEGDPLLPRQHFTDNTGDYLYVMPSNRDAKGAERSSVIIKLRKTSNFRAGE